MNQQNTVLEEEIDDDDEPSTQEIEEYAKWIGLDPAVDGDLLWIAREGFKASRLQSAVPGS
jgi:centrosomal protein CEP164